MSNNNIVFILSENLTQIPVTCWFRKALQVQISLGIRGRKLGSVHETLMIAKHETSIDFYGASERGI